MVDTVLTQEDSRMTTMEKQIEINGTTYSVRQLGQDGNGNVLWSHVDSGKVVNEKIDPTTGEHIEFNDNIEGWGYSDADSLV